MDIAVLLVTIGVLLLAGLVADTVGRRTRLPRVTLLILCGLAVGPAGLDLLHADLREWYEVIAAIALTMVAFLLGGHLSGPLLQRHGRAILTISAVAVLLTAAIVIGGLIALGTAVPLALMLGGIATATAPAATQDVIRQTKASGPFTSTLEGIVAVDDAWGLIVFSLLLALAQAVAGDGGALVLRNTLWELGTAGLLGIAIGFPAAMLTGRLREGEPMQAEALGVVFLTAGLALWLETSYLLAGMVAGAVVANLARHHARPFHEIEHIEWPFMVLFFVLAGASLDTSSLAALGGLGLAFIGLRLVGRVAGGWIGAVLSGTPASHRRWIGLALVPQAGVALGMALVGAQQLPEYGSELLAVTIGATVIFELVGPLLTQTALRRVGEAG